jgi:hypothetical protein
MFAIDMDTVFVLQLCFTHVYSTGTATNTSSTHNANATQAPNSTAVVGFKRGDRERDTISLIMSCLLTIMLCVYSAVHLNVPPKDELPRHTLWREAKWCLMALFVPEYVVYMAVKQRLSATRLCSDIQKAEIYFQRTCDSSHMGVNTDGEASLQNGIRRGRTWTMAHGFYATMGGFAIDIDTLGPIPDKLFGDTNRLTLTATGTLLLAECGLLPDLSTDDIKDKNKADSLAKILVITQATWMLVQTVGRRVVSLPITLLEVHTVAHVVCAIIMYICWWHKPRQVTSPTLIRGERLLPVAVYMYMASLMSSVGTDDEELENPYEFCRIFQTRCGYPEILHLSYINRDPSTRLGREVPVPELGMSRWVPNESELVYPDWEDQPRYPHSPQLGHADTYPGKVQQSARTLGMTRIRLVEVAANTYRAIAHTGVQREQYGLSDPPVHEPWPIICYFPGEEYVQPYISNTETEGLLYHYYSVHGSSLVSQLSFGSLLYGAIHIAAWSFYFPTLAERILWCLSSAYLMLGAAVWLIVNLVDDFRGTLIRETIFMYCCGWHLGEKEGYMSRWYKMPLPYYYMTLIAVWSYAISYCFCRGYLVVESFVSIRLVPEGVYRTPQWSQMFPHW